MRRFGGVARLLVLVVEVCPLLNAAEMHVGRGGVWGGGPPATGEVRSIRVSSSEKSMRWSAVPKVDVRRVGRHQRPESKAVAA